MFAYFDKIYGFTDSAWPVSLDGLCWIHTSFIHKRNQRVCSDKKWRLLYIYEWSCYVFEIVAFWDVMWDTNITEEMEVADSSQVLEPAYE